MEIKDYTIDTHEDLCQGVMFKFKKLDPIEHINLITRDVNEEKMDFDKSREYIKRCLRNVVWSKDGNIWTPLLDSEGGSRLPELDKDPSISLDLFYRFQNEVIKPVFYGSKTFQNFMKEKATKSNNK